MCIAIANTGIRLLISSPLVFEDHVTTPSPWNHIPAQTLYRAKIHVRTTYSR